MSWLGLLLIGFAVADLVHSWRRVPILPECVGAAVAVGAGLVAGLTSLREVTALVLIASAVVAWGWSVTRGFGRDRPALPLTVLAASVTAAIGFSVLAPPADGLLQRWLDQSPFDIAAGLSADRALLLCGAIGVQLSTGNVIVRLVLAVTGTVARAEQDTPSEQEQRLKGGRLLGPMERLLILGLALAGELTAASIVVAAKGLLRFPELSSRAEQERVHRLTEYFLVGSFVSWLVPLACLVLLA